MTGCTASGNRSDEKKMPEKIHIGTITRFIRPETASIVFARLATSRPMPGEHHRPQQDQKQRPPAGCRGSPRRTRTARTPAGSSTSGTMNSIRLIMMPPRKSALLHRRGEEPLEQLAHAHVDGHEADAPQAAAHEAHAQQARHQKVDVPPARLVDFDRRFTSATSLRPAARCS